MNRFAALAALLLIGWEGPAAAQPPDLPLVLDDLPEIGRPGGELRTLVGRARDTRLLFAFGHARLIGY
ncbi:MAG: hypothetical protein AB7O95_22660, partial [Geminicoccaceae bacterium]